MKYTLRNVAGMLAALALLAGCVTPPSPDAGKSGNIEVWWLGQSATRITTVSGKVIMIDPWILTNPKTPPQYKNLDALGKVDLILVTHAHFDHMADAPALAKKHNAPMWGPAGLNQSLLTLGVLPAELAPRMNKSGTITPFPGVRITQTHAEHSSEYVWTNPDTKKQETHVGGEPVGYIIELENGFKIYHMGDTGLFGDMKLIGEYYSPDLIMIPIGGHFVLDPKDAAKATRDYLRPKYAIPIHYGTIPQLKGTPQEYLDALGGYPVKVFPINPGDKLRF
jgi:L-ascorbate metabolism protein UlaG (beta-lactamase superfamily)